MKKIVGFWVGMMILFTSYSEVMAINDPRNVQNNRFGIHIMDAADIIDAAKLVNSSGGDWGYVTLVIREDERNSNNWQEIFKKLKDLHLIPIVRIATRTEESGWKKPEVDDIETWRVFLNSLPWPIENRYVIVGNEVNHVKEWGGYVDPVEYARYLKIFSIKLKEYSDDYFILNAGFDASAPNDKNHMSEDLYIQKMLETDSQIFDYIDGWNSHSYPNPNFSGKPIDSGRGTVRTFEWEEQLLKSLNVNRDLPVFITETGWSHDMDDVSYLGEYFKNAYANAWNNSDVVAVTPFVLSHMNAPFDIFSWKNDGGEFYSFYHDLIQVSKIKGEPKIKLEEKVLSIEDIQINDNKCEVGVENSKRMQKLPDFGKIWRFI